MSERNSGATVNGIQQENQVILFVNGSLYRGWTSVSITRKMNTFSSSFNLQMTDKWSVDAKTIEIKAGDLFHLHIDGISIMDGYLDSVSVSAGPTDKTLSVSGRSRSADLVDCSYDGATQFKKSTMKSIVEKIVAPFNIAVSFTEDPGQFEKININQGETISSILGRMCKQKDLIVYPTFGGNLIFTKNLFSRSTSEVIEGQNMLSGSVERNQSNRFSKYTVKSQGQSNVVGGPAALSNEGIATDSGIRRFRPKVIVSDNFSDNQLAKDQAKYEAAKAIAEGNKFTVVVQGWKQSDDSLWDINRLVGLRSNTLNNNGYLLCESVNYVKSADSGTVTTLGLIDKNAYSFDPSARIESDAADSGIVED